MSRELVVMFPGAGGDTAQDRHFRSLCAQAIDFQVIRYPTWQELLERDGDFTSVVASLAAQAAATGQDAPLNIAGYSLGGVIAYAVARQLTAQGRGIRSFTAVDAFMTKTAAPSPDWRRKALVHVARATFSNGLPGLASFVHSRAWRLIIRAARPFNLARFAARWPIAKSVVSIDGVLENELSMRMLIEASLPWFQSIDANRDQLQCPSALLRTVTMRDDDAIWLRRCPRIRICELSGDHHSLLQGDQVNELADVFCEAIVFNGADSAPR